MPHHNCYELFCELISKKADKKGEAVMANFRKQMKK